MKERQRWHSARTGTEMTLVRWGAMGTPVLLFPTAGGDAEEVERFLVIDALADLLAAGRVKIYSVDSVAGRAWLSGEHTPEQCAAIQNGFDACIYEEVVPAIRADCRSPGIEIITAGASIGAFNAAATLCRHPDAVSHALALSGTYDLTRFLDSQPMPGDLYFSSPLHYLPALDAGEQLERLRTRFALFAFGQGRWEAPQESWDLATLLGRKGVPNRVDAWGPEYDHDWPTWREMLPRYLEEFA